MKYKKIISLGLAISVIFTYSAVPSFAEEKMSKEETVYQITDENGENESIIVSERLINDRTGEISDGSNLKNIKNVKGDETFKKYGNIIKWNAKGKDIFYQGTSEKTMPVAVEIKYYLNGIRKSPEKMKGKSGNVKIKIKYMAKEAPYLAMCAFALDEDRFSDISVNNGQIVSTGSTTYVAGIAMPGFETVTSKLDDRIGNTIIVKAKCTDFRIGEIYSVLSNEAIKGINLNEENRITDLLDASEQLMSGASELEKGLAELNDSYGEFDKALKSLKSGVNTINSNLELLDSNLKKMAEGSAGIYEGMEELQANLQKTYDGVEKMEELKAAIQKLEGSDIDGNLQSLYTGLGGLSSGLTTLKTKLDSINSNQDELIKSLEAVSKGYKDGGIDTQSLDNIIEGMKTTSAYQKNANAALSDDGDIMNGISLMQKKISEFSLAIPEDIGELTDKIDTLTYALKLESEGAEKLTGYTYELSIGLSKAASGTSKIVKGTSRLSEGANLLKKNSTKINTGITRLHEGSNELSNGMGEIRTISNDLSNIIERAKEYESYGGNSENEDVTMKIIIKSKGIDNKE